MIDSAPARVLFDAGLFHLGEWADSGEAAVRLLRALTTRSGTGADFEPLSVTSKAAKDPCLRQITAGSSSSA